MRKSQKGTENGILWRGEKNLTQSTTTNIQEENYRSLQMALNSNETIVTRYAE